MPEGREHIPMSIQRAVKVEAGHRCAIPTCRDASNLDLCNLEPWSKVKKHEVHNIIALCPSCHRLEQEGKIDRKSMEMYKANLEKLNSRYTMLERRLLDNWASYLKKFGTPVNSLVINEMPRSSEMLVKGLVDDGLVRLITDSERNASAKTGNCGTYLNELYTPTPEGWRYITRLVGAKDVDL